MFQEGEEEADEENDPDYDPKVSHHGVHTLYSETLKNRGSC